MSPWLQLASTLLAGVLGAASALLGVRLNGRVGDRATDQRETQARREEWSKRFFQLLAYATDDSPEKREVGLDLMRAMATSDLAGGDELDLMMTLSNKVLEPLEKEFEEGDDD